MKCYLLFVSIDDHKNKLQRVLDGLNKRWYRRMKSRGDVYKLSTSFNQWQSSKLSTRSRLNSFQKTLCCLCLT